MWQTSAVLAQSALQTTRGLESGQSAVQGIASVLPPHDNAPAQTGLWGGPCSGLFEPAPFAEVDHRDHG
jgi:hypothetical protein